MLHILLIALLQNAPAPTPVLLIPGWSDRTSRLHVLHGRLVQSGWPAASVAIVEFENRFGGNVEHAAEIERAIAALKQRTGASRVDIVAHSMGGLATRYYLHFHDGAQHVRRVVFLATPHRGTLAARFAPG